MCHAIQYPMRIEYNFLVNTDDTFDETRTSISISPDIQCDNNNDDNDGIDNVRSYNK